MNEEQEPREEVFSYSTWLEKRAEFYKPRNRATYAIECLDRDVSIKEALTEYARRTTHPERIKSYESQEIADVYLLYPPFEPASIGKIADVMNETLRDATPLFSVEVFVKHLQALGNEFYIYYDDPGCYRNLEIVVQSEVNRWIVEFFVWE